MRCLSPRTVGFMADGKTIAWSQKNYSPEYAIFQLPCSKCIECRLEYARQWAVRCVHEAKMHEQNSFITLTYDDNHLKSDKLQYLDFQLFSKRLRQHIFRDFLKSYGRENWNLLSKEERSKIYDERRISIFVTGEYGDIRKRPHWHALIFNYAPTDLTFKYRNDRGDTVYTSPTLDNLWGKGITELGSVTFESAGYCARYAAKKLVHGKDGHEYEPISKKSSKRAIGKSFLEKYWTDVFNQGHIILDNGTKTTIPRYYEKWLKENQYPAWQDYVNRLKAVRIANAEAKAQHEKELTFAINEKRHYRKGHVQTKEQMRKVIINQKFKELQNYLKGDI